MEFRKSESDLRRENHAQASRRFLTLSAMEFRKSESDLRRENHAQASRRFLYPAGPWNSSQNQSPRGGASSGGLELDSRRTKMRKNEFLFTHTQTCLWNNNNNTDNISC